LTVKETAERLKVSTATVYALCILGTAVRNQRLERGPRAPGAVEAKLRAKRETSRLGDDGECRARWQGRCQPFKKRRISSAV
jgi:hypothetical protein